MIEMDDKKVDLFKRCEECGTPTEACGPLDRCLINGKVWLSLCHECAPEDWDGAVREGH